MSQVDVIRTSASRPDLFKASTESLRQKLKFGGAVRWLVHENFLKCPESEEVLRYARGEGAYDVVLFSDPSVGQGMGLSKLLRASSSSYVFNYEDDWEAVRTIDLDEACLILDENPDVNQIAFNKRDTMRDVADFKKLEVTRSGQTLVTSPHWRMTPALWRMSFIKKRWVESSKENFHWIINDKMKGGKKLRPAEWVIANTGTYYFGKFDEKQFVRHLGTGRTTRLEV